MNPQTPPVITLVVVVSIASLAFIGVVAIALSLFLKNYSDPVAFNALVMATSTLTH